MRSSLKLAALAASAVCIIAAAAQADVMPVDNLTFQDYSGAAPKNKFSAVIPGGNWLRGVPAGIDDLVYIDAPGTATSGVGGYAVYGPLNNPPPGGNFVQADGNPDFESSFYQQITGLTVGTTYTLSFWQAAGQAQGFSGETTEMWRVFFGNDPITRSAGTGACPAGSAYSSCYSIDYGTNEEQDSTVMHTPLQGVTDWNQVFMSFTATSASEFLTFLAWGDDGSNVNIPPTVFLAGVNSPALDTPEPVTLSIFGAGAAGLWLRRRAKRKGQA